MCDCQPDRTADLRAVAGEIRKANAGDRFSLRQRAWVPLAAWADCIDPPAPEPLKVNERCRMIAHPSKTGVVRAIAEDGELFVLLDDQRIKACDADELERIP